METLHLLAVERKALDDVGPVGRSMPGWGRPAGLLDGGSAPRAVGAAAGRAPDGVDGTARGRAWVGRILARVDGPVSDMFEDGVEDGREDAAEEWAEPVDPVAVWEARDDRRSERARSVHGCAGENESEQVTSEQGETDSDGRERRRAMLLGRKHQHGQNERRCDEHLDEHGLGFIDSRTGGGVYAQGTWQKRLEDACSSDGTNHLSCTAERPSHGPNGTDQQQRGRYGGIEDAAGHPVEKLDGNEKREAHAGGDVDELFNRGDGVDSVAATSLGGGGR